MMTSRYAYCQRVFSSIQDSPLKLVLLLLLAHLYKPWLREDQEVTSTAAQSTGV